VTFDTPAVLLVDDRPENLLALRAVLEPLQCRLVSVTSGEEALKALLHEDFAVVLLDVQMPGMDGFETAELIKGRERTRTVPIIFVTAISKERHNVFRGYSSGAVDYVVKPYDPGVLRSKVSVFLDLDAKSRAAAHSEAVLRAAFDYAPIGMARLDLEGRVAEANRALAKLVDVEPADLRDRLFDSLVHPDDLDGDADRRAALMAGGLSGYEHETRLVSSDEKDIHCRLSFSLARPGGAIPETVIVQVQDLREQRLAEQERERRIREQAARVEAERVSRRMEVIQRISDTALSTLAFEDLLRELLVRTVDALGADTAAIILSEPEGRYLIFQVAGGVDGGMQSRTVDELDPQPLGAVASTISHPLTVDGVEIGALHVGTLFKRRFTSEETALLALATDRAALGIQRARLFQREHRIAEELQRSLLPAGLPDMPGVLAAARYFPAGLGSQVGGDWYDVVVQPDGRILLIIGDVAGRGIEAASTMGQLRSALRAYALDGHSPSALLERLNAFQIGLRNRGMTTLGLVSVDPEGQTLRYAKAGHPPALLVLPDGGRIWLDQVPGVPLGAIDDPVYAESEMELPPGSTLILYTDGLVELRTEPLDRGFERLEASTVGAPDGIDALCDAIVTGTLADPNVNDDVTLLVLRTLGGAPARNYRHRDDRAGAHALACGEWPDEAIFLVEVELEGGAEAGAAARRALDEHLSELATAEELTDLRLAVAEVVNNAVLHGQADAVTLRFAASPERLRFEVSSLGVPFEMGPVSAVDEPGGFGLMIVDQVASRWGVSADSPVCVWAEMDRVELPAPSPAA
jgi:PAS domain S-box-containing protein